jgi:hypothetical protein
MEMGMNNTLYDWTKELFKDGIELFSDTKSIVKNGVTLNRDVTKLRKCSIGLISSATAEDWYNICRLNCDVGTIIEPFDERWNDLYKDMLLLVKATLTETLLDERNCKSAKTLIDILERRSKQEWAPEQSKKTELTATSKDNNVIVTFTII